MALNFPVMICYRGVLFIRIKTKTRLDLQSMYAKMSIVMDDFIPTHNYKACIYVIKSTGTKTWYTSSNDRRELERNCRTFLKEQQIKGFSKKKGIPHYEIEDSIGNNCVREANYLIIEKNQKKWIKKEDLT